jgi:hypothetical protein
MATSASRAGSRKSPRAERTPAPEETAEAPGPTIDSTLDAWGAEATREHLAWEIAACSAVLRGTRALRQAQMQAAEQAEAAHLEAAEKLLTARSIDDFARIQFELLRVDTEGTLQYWTRMGELMAQSAADTMQELTAGWMRAGESMWQGLGRWSQFQAAVPQTADLVEAEVEHVANPFNASPMVWPAQEAARQAATLASQGWNEWLSWGSRLANGNTSPH